MEIYDLKINGICKPLGFELPWVRVSWKVRDTTSKRAAKAHLLAAADERFENILYEKAGQEINPLGETLPFSLQPRTRYYVRVEITGDAGDSASQDTWFETGKMNEPFCAKWIGQQPEDDYHPVFSRCFTLRDRPTAARLYACGLGLYEVYCNGKKCGNEYLAPYCN